MRVLVCGGRNYSDEAFVRWVLDVLNEKKHIDMVIHGCAAGADSFGETWATSRPGECTAFGVPADWKTHGKAAGPIRNARMLELGKPDLVVAFEGGTGTADMVSRARSAGVRVLEAEQWRAKYAAV